MAPADPCLAKPPAATRFRQAECPPILQTVFDLLQALHRNMFADLNITALGLKTTTDSTLVPISTQMTNSKICLCKETISFNCRLHCHRQTNRLITINNDWNQAPAYNFSTQYYYWQQIESKASYQQIAFRLLITTEHQLYQLDSVRNMRRDTVD
jgi:hypothetical protein